jgi:hypothetical protein
MKITEDLIKNKFVAGHTGDGKPIVFVETHGGLFACFAKSRDGTFETLATAPHKAILRWMCEKKDKGIQWSPDFKGEQVTDVQKFETLRFALMGPEQMHKSDTSDYIVYDVANQVIAVMDQEELEKSIKSGEIPPNAIMRKADCSGKVTVASMHPVFGRLYA